MQIICPEADFEKGSTILTFKQPFSRVSDHPGTSGERKTMENPKTPQPGQRTDDSEDEPGYENLPASDLLEKGRLFQQCGRTDKALAYLKEAFERSPETTEGKIARVKFAALKMRS